MQSKLLSLEDRNKMVESHLNLARNLATKIASHAACPFPYRELEQQAFLSLTLASRAFDETRGIKFSTFATSRIRGNLLNYIRDRWTVVRIPRRSYEIYAKVARLESKGMSRKAIAKKTELERGDMESECRVVANCFSLFNDTHSDSIQKNYKLPPTELPAIEEGLLSGEITNWLGGAGFNRTQVRLDLRNLLFSFDDSRL